MRSVQRTAALRMVLVSGVLSVLAAAGAALPSATATEVLASRTVTQDARTRDGDIAGQVSVTVQVVREGSELQARATFHSTLAEPTVANGTLRLLSGRDEELARSNPRQLTTLKAGVTSVLVTPRVVGAACVDAQLNVWSGPQTPGPALSTGGGEALTPTAFLVQFCWP